MDTIEAVIIGVGRGRGSATNVPERALIEQVRLKPLLYDKNVKDYRKPGVSDSAWIEVANALETSVTNCKKRWKSLRDTFIKYYRLEVMYSTGESKRKQKIWSFYRDLEFLKQHVDLFRLEDKERLETSTYTKDGFVEASDYLLEDDNMKEVYEIKIADEPYDDDAEYRMKEHHLLEAYEEQIESMDDYVLTDQEEAVAEKNERKGTEQFEIYESEAGAEEAADVIEELPAQIASPAPSNRTQSESDAYHVKQEASIEPVSSPAKATIDPDERYLMSCLPAFKRFTPQQKAYVRMGIERLFYEVEFENISDPKSKRSRMS